MMSRRTLCSLLASIWFLAAPLGAQAPSISGRVVDPSGLALPGVMVTLRGPGGVSLSVTTDGTGEFSAVNLAPGRYALDAVLEGFEPVVDRELDITQDAVTLTLRMALAIIQQDVTVSAPAAIDVMDSSQPGTPVSVTREVMDIAMLPNSQIDDVLPLMPNVIRGPDGLISIAGARATSTGLYVDGRDARDPIQGGAGVMLPLDAVETMHVYTGGAPAEFGNATGGVTSIVTRAGPDQFHMSVDSFFPRLLYDNGLSGVAFWDPNFGMGGPLAKGRVTIQQSVSYRYDRNSFTTLTGQEHNLFDALLSWTQVDARVSDGQHVRVSVGADPRSTDRANVTAFTPADAMPSVGLGGWNAGVSDALAVRHLFVELRADVLHTQVSVMPHGTEPYVMGHDIVQGSYFDSQSRRATTLASGAHLTWSPSSAHTITAGASIANSTLDQTVEGQTIQQLRSDGTLARTIAFRPALLAAVGSTSLGAFIQDRWTLRPWFSVDAGARLDRSSTTTDVPVAPRLGWTLGRDGGRTTVSGGAGLFTETAPLSALAFSALPSRELVTYDSAGAAIDSRTIRNETDSELRTVQALRWDVEANQRVGSWLFRVRYEERRGRHELVVTPGIVTPGVVTAGGVTPDVVTPGGVSPDTNLTTISMLSSTGSSQSRSLETTTGFRTTGGTEWYVSYVRAATRGAQNSLDATEGLLRVPFVQVAGTGPLPADVPHRMLAWGVLHLPARFTVAPFIEWRSGFPYTAIDDQWVAASTPNAYRLPSAASLDLSVARVVGLPHHLPDARVGLKLYNIVSAHTERDVQTDLSRPDFGTAYDPVPRDFSIVFELLWGRRRP